MKDQFIPLASVSILQAGQQRLLASQAQPVRSQPGNTALLQPPVGHLPASTSYEKANDSHFVALVRAGGLCPGLAWHSAVASRASPRTRESTQVPSTCGHTQGHRHQCMLTLWGPQLRGHPAQQAPLSDQVAVCGSWNSHF